MDKKKHGIWFKLKAYQLQSRVWVAVIMTLIFILSVVIYMYPSTREHPVVSSLMLALFTSLLVTIFTTIADIYVSYKKHVGEEYLEDMKEYGIASFHRDKKKALQNMLADCDKTVWITGYRLILTRDLMPEIKEAIRRGAAVTAVICPPWTEAYNMVYGDSGKVMDNYFKVFYGIYETCLEINKKPDDFKIYFVNKPVFSDTYRVDQNLITGPYMHNRDSNFHRLMAKDFFSYEIVRQSDLYKTVNDEFLTLCEEAGQILDWNMMKEQYERYKKEDWNEAQKKEGFLKMLKSVNGK
ncbi:MAG: hypothetical protein J5824_00545 [Lachnospiraceae bacterium]|nr:hypothetical protein [Lachnospiraceae bacterium]